MYEVGVHSAATESLQRRNWHKERQRQATFFFYYLLLQLTVDGCVASTRSLLEQKMCNSEIGLRVAEAIYQNMDGLY